MSVPQGVVGNDESSWAHHSKRHLVGLYVSAFVAIDESHVESHSEPWSFRYGIANDKLYLVGDIGTLNPRSCEVFLFVVYLESIEFCALFKSFSHADGTVSTKGSHLQDILWSHHLHQHFQQSSLQVSACHASVQQLYVRCPVEPVEIVALRINVLQHVFFQQFFTLH